jgi:tetratricopeptide (TPR) repeat protein
MSDDQSLILQKAETAQELEKFDLAKKLYSEVLAQDQTNSSAWYGLAACLLHEKMLDEVEDAYKSGLKYNPDSFSLWSGLSNFYINVKPDKAKAEEATSKCLEISSHVWQSHYLRILFYQKFKIKDSEKLIQNHLDEAMRIDPNNWHLFDLKADTLSEDKKSFAQSEEYYLKALELNPDEAVLHNDYGVLLLKNGKPKQALECFREAIRLNPSYSFIGDNIIKAMTQTTPILGVIFRFVSYIQKLFFTRDKWFVLRLLLWFTLFRVFRLIFVVALVVYYIFYYLLKFAFKKGWIN